MATRLKTIEHWLPFLNTAVDASDTDFTQSTMYIPDINGISNPFKSVIMEVFVHDRNTTLGNISRHQLSISVGGAGYTAVNNANALANGGEQQTVCYSADFTSHFNTNWTTGTSKTIDARVLFDSAVVSPLNPAFNNISARLIVTYEYDDTSTTQIKTVRIPLNMPVGAMGTSKPASLATIPALDTELPESTKVYRQRVTVMQGNDNGSSTDLTFNSQVETDTAFASQVYEHGSNCAMFWRTHNIEAFDTSVSRNWYAWCSSAVGHHTQAWLVVTYEFDASASNDCFVSLLLPVEMDSPMGGTTSSDYQRATRPLWIEEPTTITTKQIAAYLFFDQLAAIAGLNARLGTGSFVTYTDAAAVLAGSNALMIRNDSAYTLARGENTIGVDLYRTDTADLGYNVSGFIIVNYTCGKPTGGYGAANHTVIWNLANTAGQGAVVASRVISATAPAIPETSYYLTAVGIEARVLPSGTVALGGIAVGVERLSSGEGGVKWEQVYSDISGTDGETGVYHAYAQARSIFKRFPNDLGPDRLDIETSRRWRISTGQSVSHFSTLNLLFTYHTNTFTVGGDVSNSNGGTVTLGLVRTVQQERVLETTRSGNGAYSITWYDNVEEVFVEAYEDDDFKGRSANGTAT
jgi:hypothetical protein